MLHLSAMKHRKVSLAVALLVGGVLVACGSRDPVDEESEHTSAALSSDASTDASVCRSVALVATRSKFGANDDSESLSPPARLRVPASVDVTGGRGEHVVSLAFQISSSAQVLCTYRTHDDRDEDDCEEEHDHDGSHHRSDRHGDRAHAHCRARQDRPGHDDGEPDRARLKRCANGARAGDVLTARRVTLHIERRGGFVPPVHARVRLDEVPPCGAADAGPPLDGGGPLDGGPIDAGGAQDGGGPVDAGGAQDGGGPVDAGVDAAADAGVCESALCVAPTSCTTASCVGATCVIAPRPDTSPCDDLNACTTGDRCSAGVCVPGSNVDPNDGNACSIDSCNPLLGVQHTPAPATTACSTGSTCTTNDHCSGVDLTCVPGTNVPIDDGQVCTSDACVEGVGVVHAPIAGCDPTATTGESPFEPRASLLGKLVTGSGGAVSGATFSVVDLPSSAPRSDVSVSQAADGSFRLRLTSFPTVQAERTSPSHVLLRVEATGFVPALRETWLRTGTAADLGRVTMTARDRAVSVIGPAGGTARDSNNVIEVIVPPGALTTTIPIVITPYARREDFAVPLPPTTPTQYGWKFEPSGTTFAVPVTVRIANTKNLSTSTPLPVGFFDESLGRWENLTQATWDGARWSFTTIHLGSSFDANRAGPPSGQKNKDGPWGPNGPCPASICDLVAGGLGDEVKLPGYRVRGEDFAITLGYESGLAASRRLGTTPEDYAAVAHSGFAVSLRPMTIASFCPPRASSGGASFGAQPGLCAPESARICALGQSTPIPLTVTRSVAGSTAVETVPVGANASEAEIGGFITLPQVSSTESASSGLFVERVTVTAQTPSACITSGTTFGVVDPDAVGEQAALEPAPLATLERHVLLQHRLTSPYGAGWSVRNVARVYRAGDSAHRVTGSGDDELFKPRAHARTLPYNTNTQFAIGRDGVTGEIFAARTDSVIDRVDPVTGASTTIFSGLGFGVAPVVHGLAIGYAGTQRSFIVALENRLVEIGPTGTTTVLATRSEAPARARASRQAETVYFTRMRSSPSCGAFASRIRRAPQSLSACLSAATSASSRRRRSRASRSPIRAA